IGAVREITGSADVILHAACSGAMTAAALAGHLASRGDATVRAMTLMVAVLGHTEGTLGLFATEDTVKAAELASKSQGILDGTEMNRVFAWLRPNDLVWNYWVNNYLMGNSPPVFDILYRVEFESLVEQSQRLFVGLPRHSIKEWNAAQIIIIRIEAFGRLALCTLDLRLLNFRRNRPHHARGDAVLQLEDVLKPAVETICPQVRSSQGIDELTGNTHPVPGFPYATFEHKANTQVATNLFHIHRVALVGKTRIAGDNE